MVIVRWMSLNSSNHKIFFFKCGFPHTQNKISDIVIEEWKGGWKDHRLFLNKQHYNPSL